VLRQTETHRFSELLFACGTQNQRACCAISEVKQICAQARQGQAPRSSDLMICGDGVNI
jgi:hypothetical protein